MAFKLLGPGFDSNTIQAVYQEHEDNVDPILLRWRKKIPKHGHTHTHSLRPPPTRTDTHTHTYPSCLTLILTPTSRRHSAADKTDDLQSATSLHIQASGCVALSLTLACTTHTHTHTSLWPLNPAQTIRASPCAGGLTLMHRRLPLRASVPAALKNGPGVIGLLAGGPGPAGYQ